MVSHEPSSMGAMPSTHSTLQRVFKHTLRDSRPSDGTGDAECQQAGRSATNLHAQASAQSLREASRPSRRQYSASIIPPSPLDDGSTSPVVADSNDALKHPRRSGSLSPPASITSSLVDETPSDPSGSHDIQVERISQLVEPPDSATLQQIEGSAAAAKMPITTMSRPPLPGTKSSLRPPEMSHTHSAVSLTHAQTPRSVRDLGSDYTRYFNPFATKDNSPNISQPDLSAPVAQQRPSAQLQSDNATSSRDVTARLSNPFVDLKRVSDPFVSVNHVATTPKVPEPDMSKAGKVTATATALEIPKSGTPGLINAADPEKVPFYPWVDDRFGAPYALPLYSDEREDDDEMHMPQWDDDKRHKIPWSERFSRDNIVNTIGVIFLLLGLLLVFIVLPIVSYTTNGILDYTYDTPLDQMPGRPKSEPWAHVNDEAYPLIKNIRSALIDPDTPASAKTRHGVNGDDYVLVFSDEFNAKNRTFYPGDDPFWFAPDIWYGATQDLEWYDPDAVNTGDGTLQLQLDAFANHGLGFRSGMLNSWNQLCFKGGIFEVSVSLPGPAGVHGLWPGIWTMGNLGRPGYLATTDGLWPYTYNECDSGITPNQSMTDGTSHLPGQRLPSCVCSGEDHPTPGTGRGAPEIDVMEVSGDWGGKGIGVATQSFQVAPFDIWYYPNYDFMEIPDYNVSFVNTYTGGPFQQAVSTTTMLNNDWYDGKEYQKYAFEYVPGGDKNAFIAWTVSDDEMMKFDGRALGPNGNVKQRLVSEEPMSMILNLGFSHSWVDIDFAKLHFPTVMRIDYVRWYQKPDQQMVTCDPPGFETTKYIADHPGPYNNPNLTHWADAGYSFPKNSLMHGCSASTTS